MTTDWPRSSRAATDRRVDLDVVDRAREGVAQVEDAAATAGRGRRHEPVLLATSSAGPADADEHVRRAAARRREVEHEACVPVPAPVDREALVDERVRGCRAAGDRRRGCRGGRAGGTASALRRRRSTCCRRSGRPSRTVARRRRASLLRLRREVGSGRAAGRGRSSSSGSEFPRRPCSRPGRSKTPKPAWQELSASWIGRRRRRAEQAAVVSVVGAAGQRRGRRRGRRAGDCCRVLRVAGWVEAQRR